jgi:hypothetical protein
LWNLFLWPFSLKCCFSSRLCPGPYSFLLLYLFSWIHPWKDVDDLFYQDSCCINSSSSDLPAFRTMCPVIWTFPFQSPLGMLDSICPSSSLLLSLLLYLLYWTQWRMFLFTELSKAETYLSFLTHQSSYWKNFELKVVWIKQHSIWQYIFSL